MCVCLNTRKQMHTTCVIARPVIALCLNWSVSVCV